MKKHLEATVPTQKSLEFLLGVLLGVLLGAFWVFCMVSMPFCMVSCMFFCIDFSGMPLLCLAHNDIVILANIQHELGFEGLQICIHVDSKC